jgi:ribosomal protein S24E
MDRICRIRTAYGKRQSTGMDRICRIRTAYGKRRSTGMDRIYRITKAGIRARRAILSILHILVE